MGKIEQIIGKDDARSLKSELNEMLSTEGTTYSDIEELFLEYGLEMDYFMDCFM